MEVFEITAHGVYVQFWFPGMAQWIPALIAVALVALAEDLAAVRLYGEMEFLARDDQSHHDSERWDDCHWPGA
ncbi:hypothetical protein ACLB1T_12395 [Escherichia coli]